MFENYTASVINKREVIVEMGTHMTVKFSGFLEELGIFGYSSLELPIIITLATQDPILFVGTHGTAKTILCKRIAEMLSLKYHCYDASKALFEDILGFPNPNTLKKGKIEYISTPISIWDKEFILIDEISRANFQTQSKWLEIIRSRKIMGLEIKNLKYIFAAMNLQNYIGTFEIDKALLGRFSMIIEIPDLKNMDDNTIKNIITTTHSDDARGFLKNNPKFNNFNFKKKIENTINKIKNDFYIKKYDDISINFVQILIKFLLEENIEIDGRRAGMLFRNIHSALSAYDYDCKDKNVKKILNQTALDTIPSFDKNEKEKIKLCIKKSSDILIDGKNKYYFFNKKNISSTLNEFASNYNILQNEEKEEFFLKLLEYYQELKNEKEFEKILEIYEFSFFLENLVENEATSKNEKIVELLKMVQKPFLFPNQKNFIRILTLINQKDNKRINYFIINVLSNFEFQNDNDIIEHYHIAQKSMEVNYVC
ncbi:MAG: MoxR family ATPase [candidate division WOR-3 bacterium]